MTSNYWQAQCDYDDIPQQCSSSCLEERSGDFYLYIIRQKAYLSREEWEAALTRTGNTAVTKATSQFEGRRLFYPKVHLYRI
jgi:hypothetical protein